MRTNRNKAISHYQKEANLLQNEYGEEAATTKMAQAMPQTEDEKPTPSTTTNEQAESAESTETSSSEICPHVLSVYETVMLIQLKRMIKRNTKAFAVMLKILIQGDPKRKP